MPLLNLSPFWLGILLSLAGCISGALGDTFVRRAHSNTLYGSGFLSTLSSPLWWLGITFAVLGNSLFTILALCMISLSIVTSFAGLHILFVIIISKVWFREPFNFLEITGAVTQGIGITSLVYSTQPKVFTDFKQIQSLFLHYKATIFFGIDLLIASIGVATTLSIFNRFPFIYNIRKISIPLSSGTMGGITNIFTKALSLGLDFIGDHSFKSSEKNFFIAIICITFSSFILQGVLWNLSLKYSSAGIVVATINSTLMTFGAFGSILVFEEYPSNYILFFLGLFCLLIGLVILVFGENNYSQLPTQDIELEQYQNLDKSFETKSTENYNSEFSAKSNTSYELKAYESNPSEASAHLL